MIFNKTSYNSNWNTEKLSDLGTFARGKSKHRPRNDKILFEGGGYPLIQTGDIKNSNLYIKNHVSEYNEVGLKQSRLWNKGTLCITIAANIAETGILDYPMCFPDSVVGFTPDKNKCTSEFMHYIFNYIKTSIQSSASGSIQDNINIDYLSNLEFKIPNLNIQNKIVGILSNIDKKININTEIICELNKCSEFIYLNKIIKPYLESKDGNIVKLNISDIVELKTGKQDANFSSASGKYPFFTCSNEILKCDKYEYDGKAVLLAGNGEFNVKYFEGKFNAYQRTYILMPNDSKYIGLIYESIKLKIQNYKKGSNGSIVKFITKDDVDNTKIYCPKNERLVNKINDNLNLINKLYIENEELYNLKKYLLPLLMNGQISFKNE